MIDRGIEPLTCVLPSRGAKLHMYFGSSQNFCTNLRVMGYFRKGDKNSWTHLHEKTREQKERKTVVDYIICHFPNDICQRYLSTISVNDICQRYLSTISVNDICHLRILKPRNPLTWCFFLLAWNILRDSTKIDTLFCLSMSRVCNMKWKDLQS